MFCEWRQEDCLEEVPLTRPHILPGPPSVGLALLMLTSPTPVLELLCGAGGCLPPGSQLQSGR